MTAPADAARDLGRSRRLFAVGLVAACDVAADQVTKSLAVAHLSNGPVHLLGPFSLALAYNSGVAFSLATGATAPIVAVGVLAVAAVAWFGRAVASWRAALALGLLLGGALGNLADRLFRGHGGAVVDFIHSGFWPTFNLADASVVLGCIGLGLLYWGRARDETAKTGEPA